MRLMRLAAPLTLAVVLAFAVPVTALGTGYSGSWGFHRTNGNLCSFFNRSLAVEPGAVVHPVDNPAVFPEQQWVAMVDYLVTWDFATNSVKYVHNSDGSLRHGSQFFSLADENFGATNTWLAWDGDSWEPTAGAGTVFEGLAPGHYYMNLTWFSWYTGSAITGWAYEYGDNWCWAS